MTDLNARSGGSCELCGSGSGPTGHPVDGDPDAGADKSVLLCDTCQPAVAPGEPLEGSHWFCLQESIWSEVPAVQVLSYRLLHRMGGQPWATDLLEQAWLADDVLTWAKAGLGSGAADGSQPVDSNGAALQDGDSVTLIKDLVVKGAGFTAKRGTMVRNIRVGDDPTHIQGKVNGVVIMLKTEFLKRAS